MTSREREQFSTEELAKVLSHYDVGIIDDVVEFARGSRRSPKLYLSTQKGNFLLKRRARGKDSAARVLVAHRLQQFLAEHDFPVARLSEARPNGDTLLRLDGYGYELFEYVNGLDYDGGLASTFAAGRTLGEFHKLVAAYVPDPAPPRDCFHDANAVRTGLNAIPSSLSAHDSVVGFEADLEQTINALYQAYDAAASEAERWGVTHTNVQIVHSDWHPGNLLFRDNQVVAVVDFDSVRIAPRVTDLANGALQFSIIATGSDPKDWPDYFDETRMKRFLLGYDQETAVSAEEIQALVPLVIEALIAEAAVPIAATGSFGRMQGFGFLRMIKRKVRWLQKNASRLVTVLSA